MIQTIDIGWVAGFLEGEGCFQSRKSSKNARDPFVSAVQKESEPLMKLQVLFGGKIKYLGPCKSNPKRNIFEWSLHNRKAICIMMTIFSLMSSRRKKKIANIINLWRTTWDNRASRCKRGHIRTQENTKYYSNGRKTCKICRIAYQSKYQKQYRSRGK